MRPLIGITAYHNTHPKFGWDYQVCYQGNASAIEAAGGLPVLLPSNVSPETARETYQRLDGLLLPGGGDIHPEHYEQASHESIKYVDEARDAVELALTRWAIDDDLPVLGVCRGNQMLNVALGGSLIQDVPTMVQDSIHHPYDINNPRSKPVHDVDIVQDSLLHTIMGDAKVAVNSLHHQSVDRLAPGLRAVAHAPDGVVEAVEMPGKSFVLAVQWHPEDMINDDARMHNLFVRFVAAARESMAASR